MANPLSTGVAIKLLISKMRDPMKASVFSIRMGVACIRFSEDTVCKIVYREFLIAGIKFLAFNRSSDKHFTMVKSFAYVTLRFLSQ